MLLRSGYLLIAQRLQEAADNVSHSMVRSHLSDAIQDAHKGSGHWANYVDHTGDGKTGDVIYNVDGDTMSCPYSITSTSGKQTAAVDTEKAAKVIPVVSYKKQVTSASEAALPNVGNETGLKLVESMPWAESLLLSESVASGIEREIRIIVPCIGSSAVYTEAALQKSAGAFRKGTQMFINHATPAEEAARPEGDYRKLVGQLSSDATWKPDHKDGAALYANAKFVSSMAPEILEKASMSGVSIKANGRQATEAGRPLFKNNKPVLEEITSVESIDLVTKAGAGGLILTEAARTAAPNTGDSMTTEQLKVLEAAGKLILLGEARRVALEALSDVSLNESAKEEVIRRVTRAIPTKEGLLDEAPFRESVKEEAKAVGAFVASVSGSGNVRYMGGGAPVPVAITEAQREADRLQGERRVRESESIFADLLGAPEAAKFAAKGRAA